MHLQVTYFISSFIKRFFKSRWAFVTNHSAFTSLLKVLYLNMKIYFHSLSSANSGAISRFCLCRFGTRRRFSNGICYCCHNTSAIRKSIYHKSNHFNYPPRSCELTALDFFVECREEPMLQSYNLLIY